MMSENRFVIWCILLLWIFCRNTVFIPLGASVTVFIVYSLWAPPSRHVWVYPISIQAGLWIWMLISLVAKLDIGFINNYFLTIGGAVAWLYVSPGLLPIVVLVGMESVIILVILITIHAIEHGYQPLHAGQEQSLVVHATFAAVSIYFMIKSYKKFRLMDKTPEE